MFYFAFVPVILTKYYLGDEIKDKEMGKACSTHSERDGKCVLDFFGETWRKVKELGVEGRAVSFSTRTYSMQLGSALCN
jgi:hypothetical protein